ncbi:Uncharacterised protein [Neisseria zoodegmatis]|nr:Uncharacterised protein [Neisseria zoodegmatis]
MRGKTMNQITLLSEKHHDYAFGFEVQSPEKLLVSWDAAYDEVITLPCVERDDPYLDMDFEIGSDYCFRYPVRVGNVLFEKWCFHVAPEQRTDIVVQEYYADIATGISESDFQQIHHHLEKVLPLEKRSSKASASVFCQNGITLYLKHFAGQEYPCLQVLSVNTRDYFDLPADVESENSMKLSGVLVFPQETVSTGVDYKKDASVKRRPPVIAEKFGRQTVVWRDDKNKLLGVCAGNFSQTYPLAHIEQVGLERVFSMKGGGEDFVRLHLSSPYAPKTILTARYGYFNPYIAALEKLLQKPVVCEQSGFFRKHILPWLAKFL